MLKAEDHLKEEKVQMMAKEFPQTTKINEIKTKIKIVVKPISLLLMKFLPINTKNENGYFRQQQICFVMQWGKNEG